MTQNERAKQLGNDLTSCDGMNEESRIEAGEHLLRLVEENGRMRRAAEKTLAGQGRCAHDPDDPDRWAKCNLTEPPFCDFCQGMQDLAAFVTPTPAVEQEKPKCQTCDDTMLVPATGAPGFVSPCTCAPRPGPEHYITSAPKCGTCSGTGETMVPKVTRSGRHTEGPGTCPDCATSKANEEEKA